MPKERTKGQKEIYRDNQSTLSFYFKVSLIATVAHVILSSLINWLWYSTIPILTILLMGFGASNHWVGQWLLRYISKAVINEKGEVLDAGSDLQNNWIAEYATDIIWYMCILQFLSLFTNYAWFLWLVIPGFAFYKIWIMFLWPWFKAGSEPNSNDGDNKKKKKIKKTFR